LSQDREGWNKLSRELYDETLLALKAVDAKDVAGVVNAGARIDNACESCHLKYWYPKSAK
jgi:cytochrome c556